MLQTCSNPSSLEVGLVLFEKITVGSQLCTGKLRCIGATTLAEYRQYIETDTALERRFAQVVVNEPTVPETISILRGIREKYEVHHGVKILDGSLISAAQLAHRYLTSRRLPDAAIDLVDEACAR